MKSDNIEALREKEESRKEKAFYEGERDFQYAMLYPDEISGGTVSATGSTGLIQIIPTTLEEYEFYEEVNSYRQKQPIVSDEEK